LHDATAGTPLAGAEEVVCHHDLGQHNIVFRGDDAVPIIDWDDDVAPGPRLLDVSHAVWCLAELGPQGGAVAAQARRVRLVADAYGRDDRLALIEALELRFRRALSDAERTRRAKRIRVWSREVDWLAAHGPDLEERLS
jgi:Ser/Thr protein kinase RdoA (MazF antagonist)